MNLHIVPHAKDDSEQHVEDSDNDGNLHLVAIHENDLIFSNLDKRQAKPIVEY